MAFLMRTMCICLQIICCVTNHPKLSGLKQTPFGGFATWVLLFSLMWLHPICRSTGTGWSWVSSLTCQIGSSPIPLVLCRNNRLSWELASFGNRALKSDRKDGDAGSAQHLLARTLDSFPSLCLSCSWLCAHCPAQGLDHRSQ